MSGMADKDRIVITGIGVVSPIGIGKEGFWQALSEGRSGIKPVTLFDTSTMRSKLACEAEQFNPEEILGSKENLKKMDRTTKLALCAAKLALEDAHFEVSQENALDTGVVIGTANGSVYSTSELDKKALRDGPYTINPAMFPNTVMCCAPSQVAIRFGIKGLSSTISSGFNSGFESVDYSAHLIRAGHVKYILVGAVEELCEQTFKAFYRLGLLSGSKDEGAELSAPLDRRRNGFIMAEGAVIFLMETLETARSRGAKVYAEIRSTFKDDYLTRRRAVKKCLADLEDFASDLKSKKETMGWNGVDFLSIGVNSSRLRDFVEAKIIHHLFQGNGQAPVISGIKSMVGESFSASGCFQIVGALYCMDTNLIFPTTGIEKIDERCRLQNLASKPFRKEVKKSAVFSANMGTSTYFMTLQKI